MRPFLCFPIALVSLLAISVIGGCDEAAEDCAEGEVCSPGVGGAAGSGGQVGTITPYPFVVISDISAGQNTEGTTDVDICGVRADCGGEARTATIISFEAGAGDVCGQPEVELPTCGEGMIANDPQQAIDSGAECELTFDSKSGEADFVSLSIGGSLIVGFDSDLQGCTVSIVEHSGAKTEGYTMKLCAAQDDGTPDLSRCISERIVSEGGNAVAMVP